MTIRQSTFGDERFDYAGHPDRDLRDRVTVTRFQSVVRPGDENYTLTQPESTAPPLNRKQKAVIPRQGRAIRLILRLGIGTGEVT